ncbi:MAG: hypothetical protein JWR60_4060, partial [Polaromonas sp.]|nr:hypothetical protein [Polaromonas sp.]
LNGRRQGLPDDAGQALPHRNTYLEKF